MSQVLEDYLDNEEKFYDYGTSDVNGRDIFDTTKTGMSYYDYFIHKPEYMYNKTGYKGDIIQLTPNEYFDKCAELFNTSTNREIESTLDEDEIIEHLKEVILKYHKKFPITFISAKYTNEGQEGRHRMAVAGELFGWNTRFPVLYIH